MDLLKILEESTESLYLEDLDFFEVELDTGDYTDEYISRCHMRINQMRKWFNGEVDEKEVREEGLPIESGKVYVPLSDIAPGELSPVFADKTPVELFKIDVEYIRSRDKYKAEFKKFIASHALADADFIDEHFSFFTQWEIGAIITVRQLGEPFLEKYFGAIDLNKVSRYQQFSESFFMKHFSHLNVDAVLKNSPNEWRKKENRSSKLDVFLRLKGVKI